MWLIAAPSDYIVARSPFHQVELELSISQLDLPRRMCPYQKRIVLRLFHPITLYLPNFMS